MSARTVPVSSVVMSSANETEPSPYRYALKRRDFERMIGMRARRPVVHPHTGVVLVQPGEVMTRSVVMSLVGTGFSIEGVRP